MSYSYYDYIMLYYVISSSNLLVETFFFGRRSLPPRGSENCDSARGSAMSGQPHVPAVANRPVQVIR